MCRESHLIASDNIDDNDESHGISGARVAKCNVNSILQSLDGLKATTFRNARVEKPAGNRCASWWCKGRAKPYYDNIFVYDAEMRLVFTVDKSKAEWYVYKKGLGKVIEWRETAVEETQKTEKEIAAIQLNFSPDLSKYNDAHIRRNLDYFRQAKENQCVVCGEKKDLVRFAVVPLAYRKYFPSVYMSHNSYDLLLLCTVCFARARRLYDEERRRVAVDFGVPWVISHQRNWNCTAHSCSNKCPLILATMAVLLRISLEVVATAAAAEATTTRQPVTGSTYSHLPRRRASCRNTLKSRSTGKCFSRFLNMPRHCVLPTRKQLLQRVALRRTRG
ncbi:hypothetical protein C4B63_92g108 [Trypanosoma cruzi]|uniref:Uncharacterized protein n=1 Tax=Trypanosoma cruzi TaxID=5693 RepID=A0A2V2UT77_TRYCR|nr:hypothetical protein C4B63_92g108 [Trypanosoma cruzi]